MLCYCCQPGGPLTVETASGKQLVTDLIMLVIGVRPETQLAKAAGLELGQRGGIKVDSHMRTSDPSIFAVGEWTGVLLVADFISEDLRTGVALLRSLQFLQAEVSTHPQLLCGVAVMQCAHLSTYLSAMEASVLACDPSSSGDAVEVKDYVTQEQALIPLAGPANRQGRIAADNIAGRSSSFRGSQGTSVLGLFGMTLAGTGASEKTLQRIGRAYNKVGRVCCSTKHRVSTGRLTCAPSHNMWVTKAPSWQAKQMSVSRYHTLG